MKRFLLITTIFSLMICSVVPASNYLDLPEVTSITISDDIHVEPKIFDKVKKNRDASISGIIPSIIGDEYLENKINEIVSAEVNLINGNITFDYKIVRSAENDTISFIIKSTTATSPFVENVSALVIDAQTLEEVTISDLLGGSGLKIAMGVVNDYIASAFRNMPRVSSLKDNVDFYVTDEAVYFLFDKYEIAPGSEGIQAVPVHFDNIKRVIIEKENYYNNHEKYNVKMLPLRQATKDFGYDIRWNRRLQEVELIKNSGEKDEVFIKIKINENSYLRTGELTPQALEAPPELKSGLTYVPLTFMEVILDISYYVENDGTIELARYDY